MDNYNDYNEKVDTFGGNFRGLNSYVMSHTYWMCENDKDVIEAIKFSKEHEYIVYENDNIDVKEDGPTTNIIINNKRSFEAASEYKGKKVAVLNFANNHSVGGSPWSAGAQEESMCRCSTLFPCLDAKKEEYHYYHQSLFNSFKLGPSGNDDLIYIPQVMILKTDESAPKILNDEDRFKVDIITSAAPEYNKMVDKSLDKLEKILESRIDKIIRLAKKENVEVLILGAYGCGAFRNPPSLVAKAFKKSLNKYNFNTVVFPIFSRDIVNNNKIAFEDVFKVE